MDWINWNIAFAVLIGILTVIVAGLAGHLASTKLWHKVVFWGAGIFTVILIYCQVSFTEKEAKKNATEQHALRLQLDQIQARINKDQKAVVGLFKIGLAVQGQELKSKTKIPFVIAYVVGNNIAKGLKSYEEIFTVKGDGSTERNRKAHAEFLTRAVGMTDSRGEDRIPGTGNFRTLELTLNREEIQQVIDPPKRIVYIMGRVEWNNLDGSEGHLDVCKLMQPPKMKYLIQSDLPFHDCGL